MKKYLKSLVILMCLPIVSCASYYHAYNTKQLRIDKTEVVYQHSITEPWKSLVTYCATEHCKVYNKVPYLTDRDCKTPILPDYCITTFECR